MATHSSILTRRIPGTGDPGGLQSMGSQSQTQRLTHTHILIIQTLFIYTFLHQEHRVLATGSQGKCLILKYKDSKISGKAEYSQDSDSIIKLQSFVLFFGEPVEFQKLLTVCMCSCFKTGVHAEALLLLQELMGFFSFGFQQKSSGSGSSVADERVDYVVVDQQKTLALKSTREAWTDGRQSTESETPAKNVK